jgi:hypothetical protein
MSSWAVMGTEVMAWHSQASTSVEKGRGYTTPAGQKRFEKLYYILADKDFPRFFIPPAAGQLGVDESVAGS